MEYRKKVLEYAEQHEKAADIMKTKRYYVPDAKVKAVPTEYVEEVEEHHHGGNFTNFVQRFWNNVSVILGFPAFWLPSISISKSRNFYIFNTFYLKAMAPSGSTSNFWQAC